MPGSRRFGTLLTTLLVAVASAPVSADHNRAYQLVERRDIAGLKAEVVKDPSVVNSRNENGMPLLHRAAMTACVECVAVLLAGGADLKATDKTHRRTAVHGAAGWSTVEMVQLFVSKGAAINARAANGDTPLSFAREQRP